jgi:23S rRNA pseudouridine1911/1915/1917 synthase
VTTTALDVEVPADLVGARLDVAAAALLEVSRSRAAARIAAGEVTVDGVVASANQRLRAGQRVVVTDPAERAAVPPPPLPPIRFEDDHLLVLAKPAGLVVHPGAGRRDGTLVDALRAAGRPLSTVGGDERPGIVHRLDRDTSGLLLVAKHDAAHEALVAALASRSVTRRYLALVAGVPRAPRARIDAPIGRDPQARTRFAVVAGGRPAVTRTRTLASGQAPDLPPHRGEVALLACKLESGRTHQIRVHLTGYGHPIVGDPVYGPRRELATALGCARPWLHAAVLGFDHPVTGERHTVVEPLPDELLAVLVVAGITPPDVDALAALPAEDA